MSEKKEKKGMSRRRFLKSFGTGVVGSSVLIHGVPAAVKAQVEGELPAEHKDKVPLELTVNGKQVQALVEPRTSLADLLRNQLQLTGTKIVCNQGECGSCTVLMEGIPIYSCQTLALDAAGKSITTIEGLLDGEELHPLQKAFIDHDGYQCGFCTPGQIMAAQGLLNENPNPTREEALIGMSGNLCRCAAYPKIIDSVLGAAKKS